MRKLVTALAFVLVTILAAGPASALFVNGGFETGDFTGWTITPGSNYGGPGTVSWGSYPGYSNPVNVVVGPASVADSYAMPYLPAVYNGNYMARINDAYGNNDATRLSQTDTVTALDVATGGNIYVNWGAVLDNPNHSLQDQPFFGIEILKNGASIGSFYANSTDAANPANGWTNVGTYSYTGDILWYQAAQFAFPMTDFALGDTVTVSMFVADCDLGGHGGYAFLDGISAGTAPPPPPGGQVPEPGTMMLLGSGLVGLAAWRRKK